jgi:hypothetical protein
MLEVNGRLVAVIDQDDEGATTVVHEGGDNVAVSADYFSTLRMNPSGHYYPIGENFYAFGELAEDGTIILVRLPTIDGVPIVPADEDDLQGFPEGTITVGPLSDLGKIFETGKEAPENAPEGPKEADKESGKGKLGNIPPNTAPGPELTRLQRIGKILPKKGKGG